MDSSANGPLADYLVENQSPFFLTQLRISPAAATIASRRPPPPSHLAGRRHHHRISPAATIIIASRRPPPSSSHLAGRHHHHRISPAASSAQAPSTRSISPADAGILRLRSRRRETLAVRRLAPRQGRTSPAKGGLLWSSRTTLCRTDVPHHRPSGLAPAIAREMDPQMQMRHRCDGALLPQPAASWHPCPAPDENDPRLPLSVFAELVKIFHF
jgi:hypothetical protein